MEAETYRATSLGLLDETWLEMRCGRRKVVYPVKLLLRRFGPRTPLGDVLPRFRCERCGKRPERAVLTNSPKREASGTGGADDGWHIDIRIRGA